MELLDGTLKLRHCTDLFTMHFAPWSLFRVGNGCGKRQFITHNPLTEAGGNMGKRVRLTKKTRPGVFFTWQSGSIQRRGDGNDCAPLPPKEWGVRWACFAIFFLALGLGEVCTGDAWNLLSEATGVGLLPARQSSRRDQCTGTGPF